MLTLMVLLRGPVQPSWGQGVVPVDLCSLLAKEKPTVTRTREVRLIASTWASASCRWTMPCWTYWFVLVVADVADALRSLVAKGKVPAAWPSLVASRAEVPGPARVWRLDGATASSLPVA